MRYIKGNTPRGAARRHVLARLLETRQRQMPMDEKDLLRYFLYNTTDHREVIVFGIVDRDSVVYVRVQDVPDGDRLCARIQPGGRAAPCFSTPAQIQDVFRQAVRDCGISSVVPMVHGPPLLLFWLAQVLMRLARLAPGGGPVATSNVQDLMLNDRYYPGSDIHKSVAWLYRADKALRAARNNASVASSFDVIPSS